MRALVETDVHQFAARALPWLGREPVGSNVLASNLDAALDGRRSFPDALWLAVIDEAGDTVGAAMHTPPYRLFICPMAPEPVRVLACALAPARPDLRGVSGVMPTAEGFAEQWHQLTGADVTPGMAQRLYRLDTVVAPPTGVLGRRRDIAARDRKLLLEWLVAFHHEAVPGQPVDSAGDVFERALAEGGWSVWELGDRPVSLAGARPPAAGVARVGPVYTPPADRRRGYAGACVAAVSQRALDTGARQCMLYTDLSNPTSNAVYQRIGYRPVCDAQEYDFSYS